MTPDLPDVLTRYFAAQNAHGIDTLVDCFAPDAVVRDEGNDIVGSDEIRAWKEETGAKYRVTVEPLTCSVADGCAVVVARVSGSFDGSPLYLTYRFGISEEDRIATLQVR